MTQSTSAKMKVGIVLETGEGRLQGRTPTFRELQEMAQTAERAGLDSVWLFDHLLIHFPEQKETGMWEAFTLLSALAASTTRITLGTLVACTSFRHPALLAKMADTIDEISGGRLILGLGAGWHKPEYEAFGYPFDHLASRFEEAMQIIAPLLREGHVDFQGQYYQVHQCVLHPRGPSRHGPPILIAGSRPRMLQLTAQYADAWNTAWHVEPGAVKERYDEFKKACATVGRDVATVELTAGTFVSLLSPDEDTDTTKAISGSPEAIAHHLQGFAEEGVTHLIATLKPFSRESIEQFGHIVELLRQH